jgi:glycerol-3-phosphate dehydrogenase (NAD(P)+)
LSIVTVIGAGRMGTAICTPLLDRGHEVRLVGTHLDVAYVDALRETGIHPGLGHALPSGASYHQVTELPQAVAGADMLLLGVSSAGIDWATRTLAPLVDRALPMLFLTKGIRWDGDRFRMLPDVLVGGLPEAFRDAFNPVGVTGPCVAGELIRRRDTCVTFTGRDLQAVNVWAQAISTPYYHVWQSTDFEGCEASAALKNAFAIAVGFSSGALGQSETLSADELDRLGVAAHNIEAGVFAEAIVEMARLVGLMGGDPRTPEGLVGVGDLLVTLYARSIRLGRLLGTGLTLDEALDRMAGVTLEGVATIRTIAEALSALDARGVTRPNELPLMRHLVSVVAGGRVDIPFDSFFGGRAPAATTSGVA